MPRSTDQHYLRTAARLALRGHGGAEPNPLVGCVIVSPAPEMKIVGWGYHRKYGGPHAEIEALLRAGSRAAGATLYCTLEPCNHTGKTGPCTQAVIDAKVARVVIGQRDPYPPAAGGIERLRTAGIAVDIIEDCREAAAVTRPFLHRLKTGLPWVIAKWAQTIDGKVAAFNGESKWISNEASRRMVHRERGRVDAILTGIGTVVCDDPLLTARGVRIKRIARRVIIDPRLRMPLSSKIVATARATPTFIICDEALSQSESASELGRRGVEVLGFAATNGELPLDRIMRMLVERFEAANVLVEAGPGLLSRLFRDRLVNQAWVFTAPLLLGDENAKSSLKGASMTSLAEGTRFELQQLRQRGRRGGDVVAVYDCHG